jgi:hypothetical protein
MYQAYQQAASVQDFLYRPLFERVVNERTARATAEGDAFWFRITGTHESELTKEEKDAVLQNPVISMVLFVADGQLVDMEGGKLDTPEELRQALSTSRNDGTFIIYLNTQSAK